MSAIKKSILVNGSSHFIEINSSLDLEEVEITGSDPASGKTVHISLSSLLKSPKQPEPSPYAPQPYLGASDALSSPSSQAQSPPPSMDMFSDPQALSVPAPSQLSASQSIAPVEVGAFALPMIQSTQALQAIEDAHSSLPMIESEGTPDDVTIVEPSPKGLEAIKKESIQASGEDLDSAIAGLYGYA